MRTQRKTTREEDKHFTHCLFIKDRMLFQSHKTHKHRSDNFTRAVCWRGSQKSEGLIKRDRIKCVQMLLMAGVGVFV